MKVVKVIMYGIYILAIVVSLAIPFTFKHTTIKDFGISFLLLTMFAVIAIEALYIHHKTKSKIKKAEKFNRDLIKQANKKSPTGCRRKRLRSK